MGASDGELVEIVGKLAIDEYAAWKARNAARTAFNSWRKQWVEDTGEYYAPGDGEDEHIQAFDRLQAESISAQKNLIKARCATRRAVSKLIAARETK